MSQQQKSPYEDIILFIIVAGLLGGASYAIWHVFHLQITNAIRWVRWAELWAAGVLVGDNYSIVHPRAGEMTVGQWRAYLPSAPVTDIQPVHIVIMTRLAVPPLAIPLTVLLGLMGLCVMFFGPGTRFRRRLNLEGLMREQSRSFPAIQPFLKFDPRKAPPRVPGQPVPAQLPMFAEALSPEEWIAYNEVRVTGGRVDAAKVYESLSVQLGNRWRGPEKLPLHAQGLFAAFALKHVRKRKDSEALLNALSLSWSHDQGFRPSSKLAAQIKKVIRNPKLGGELAKFADEHAWETTALLRCLSRARSEGGVLAPSEFLWLRGLDRALWYPLNNLGRKSYHAEAAGAMVHYTNELISGQKIPTPRFDDVVRGLETYLRSGIGRAIPPLEKKAGGRKS